jgi:hypothetical protein
MSLNEGKKEEGKTPSLWQGKKSLSLVREKLDTSIKERHPVQEPGIYIVKYSRTPNLESIFHRQQRLLCVCRYSPGRNGLFQGFGGGGGGREGLLCLAFSTTARHFRTFNRILDPLGICDTIFPIFYHI